MNTEFITRPKRLGVALSAKISGELYDRLCQLADEHQVSLSSLVRQILQSFLDPPTIP